MNTTDIKDNYIESIHEHIDKWKKEISKQQEKTIPEWDSAEFRYRKPIHNSLVKRVEVLEFTEDVLALSCAWYRHREARTYLADISSLTDEKLFALVEEQDRTKANEIRDYYSKKIMMWVLLEKKLTAFREDLRQFISGSKNHVSEKMLPLVYRLPEFYTSDADFDLLRADWVRNIPTGMRALNCTITLTPLKRIEKTTRSMKRLEYWFKDSDGYAYAIFISNRIRNPLLHLWENMFFSNKPITLSGDRIVQHRDDLEYFGFRQWNLAESN